MKRTFTYIIEQDEDGFYTADVQELPGCHTQAKSLDELKIRVLDAIKLFLDENGRHIQGSRFIGVQQIEASIE